MTDNVKASMKYSINLGFEEVRLPPFQDILVLGKNAPQGKIGIYKSFELLVPNGYDFVEIHTDNVEAVFINKKIVAKMPVEKILNVLKARVFPFISEGELLKVDFKIAISYSNIEEETH